MCTLRMQMGSQVWLQYCLFLQLEMYKIAALLSLPSVMCVGDDQPADDEVKKEDGIDC